MNIRTQAETKIRAYLQSVTSVTYPILLGQDMAEKGENSFIIVYAPSATSADLGLQGYGNFIVKLDVHIYTDINEGTLDSHRDMQDEVEHALQQEVQIRNAWEADTSTLYCITLENPEEAKDEQHLGTILHYEIQCCYQA